MTTGSVLVVGATGNLGGKVVRELLGRDKRVRALVRQGSDATKLTQQGVEVVRGDLTQPASLGPALDGVDALVTTAAGYVRRRRGDTLRSVDDQGNRHLIEAASHARLGRFVFTSVLAADQARGVPHFYQKYLIEQALEASGLPFVALRPGGFIDTGLNPAQIRRGLLTAVGNPETPQTAVLTDDVARVLALAVDEPRAVGQRIDLGTDRPASFAETARVLSRLLEREVKVRRLPLGVAHLLLSTMNVFKPGLRDYVPMFEFIATGRFVADTSRQLELFGPVPSLEEALTQWLSEVGLRPIQTVRLSSLP
ncbi:SDR family oxidoreductase [Deinococcus sp. SDU3-2]|uniref:SDR family oxidoreductase n=1 Tax=Deinococcus terrestris TaxID=2651870 RepID=A0A7X1TSZ4_9DEIO|nr:MULTISPECIES: SDR family oxidoreductase [Deinococcus]MPY68368.1 SDR family oxidoreductase [Deinococcus terrestris]